MQQQQTATSAAQLDEYAARLDDWCADFARKHFSQEPTVTQQFFVNISFARILQPAVTWGVPVSGLCHVVRFDRNAAMKQERKPYWILKDAISEFSESTLQRADGLTLQELKAFSGEGLKNACMKALTTKYGDLNDTDVKNLSHSDFEYLRQLSFAMSKSNTGWTYEKGPPLWGLETQLPKASQPLHDSDGESSARPVAGQETHNPDTQVEFSYRYLVDKVTMDSFYKRKRPAQPHTSGRAPWSDLTNRGAAYRGLEYNMSPSQGFMPNMSGAVHGYAGTNAAGNLQSSEMIVPQNSAANTSGSSHGYGEANAGGSAGFFLGADMSVPWNDMANTFGMMHGHDGGDVWGSAGSVPMLNMSAPQNHLIDPFGVDYENNWAVTGVGYDDQSLVLESPQTADQINPSGQTDPAWGDQ